MIIGKGFGVKILVLLMDMNNLIGKKIGNVLEVVEFIDCFYGNGLCDFEDLVFKLGNKIDVFLFIYMIYMK